MIEIGREHLRCREFLRELNSMNLKLVNLVRRRSSRRRVLGVNGE